MDVLNNVGLELNSVVGYSNPKGPRFNEFARRGPPNYIKAIEVAQARAIHLMMSSLEVKLVKD